MVMTCPIGGCQSTGWCKHKTMMVVLMVAIVAAIVAYVAR